MVNDKQIWIKRRADYWGMAIKYLKLIGNSGFLFALYLLFVFGSYYYGKFLQWLPETFPATIFFTIVFTWMITRGRVRTFAKQGDLFFLTPTEKKLSSYFRSAMYYSWGMETVYLSFLFLLLAPLFFDRIHSSGAFMLTILCFLSFLKCWNLMTSFEEQRLQEKNRYYLHGFIRLGLNAITIYALFTFQSIFFIGALVLLLVIFYFGYFQKLGKTHSLKWERLVEIENQTVMTFYRIANSFTDVPVLKSKVRPRKWLSFLFSFVKYKKAHVYHYLFIRAFTRSNDYFGIYIRLTLLAILFVSVIEIDWGRWFIVILFSYMTALQIQTLKHHFDTSSMVEIYPVSMKEKFRSHQYWLYILGTFQALIFSLSSSIMYSLYEALFVFVMTLTVYIIHSVLLLKRVYAKQ
ncbi:ABC transporter permease [Evansella cellulosilytica]|uniref:ABC transporter EcsB n=1 Tax=Evansella cellulosilytica (strain ATCC 21833 / DSM 2522 / FERM P-1141 / JCM 9156 / N-4) TaxID=649639 RepID=E6TV53_EVAC2|nr:ABC transporter permease [Evansella cellulosilytica]ADU29737.1 ABC transporter EcsB [Evansella cellulosilytica DSM 2522]